MLSVTGLIDQKIEEDKLVPAQSMISLFDLPFKLGDKVRFRVLAKHIKRDRRGQKRMAVKRLLPCYVEGVYKNNQYAIRYYASKTQRQSTQHANAFTVYSPTNLTMKGEISDFDTVVDGEIAIMLMLSPKCKNGPFANPRIDSEYEFVDTEAEAKRAFEREVFIQEALDFFKKSKDEEKIMRIAKGFIVPGTGSGVDRSLLNSPIETRMAMITIAKKHPKAVAESLSDPVVLTRGAISNAIDEGLITLSHQAGGTGVYKWKDGTEIVKVKSISTALDHLLKYALSPDIHDTFFAHLNKTGVLADIDQKGEELKNAGKGDAAVVNVDLTDPLSLITKAIEFNQIILETSDMKVRFVQADGQIQKSFPLGEVSSVIGWEDELAGNIKNKSQVMGRLRKLVANKLKE